MPSNTPKLRLGFHGRIIDHLGIQMYQSPTAAIAEIVSNAWDADSELVEICFDFTSDNKADWTITIKDNGNGMSFDDCQHRYLSVGYNRRATAGPTERSPLKQRPVMGRKGIGKFAGFGIARFIKIKTISRTTTELTEFELDLHNIRQGDSYVSTSELEIDVTNHAASQTTISHGTEIILRDLKLLKRIPENQFSDSLTRKFSINTTADQFELKLNGNVIAESADQSNIEMSFPRDFSAAEKTQRQVQVDSEGWGEETLESENTIKWKINFYNDLIKDKEIAGITVFAHKKLAQVPFLFNLTGGLASQAGPEYMSGKVIADWVDELGEDVISTERQRLNWENPEVAELQEWGQQLIRRLMSIWKEKRTAQKMAVLEGRIDTFSERIIALGSEGRVIKGALTKLAQIEKLNQTQFIEMGSAILLAWEGGRLRELIRQIASSDDLDEVGFLDILTEANAITALHTAETVNAKLAAIQGLEQRINDQELENSVRDYISHNPWLISPKWETFAREQRVASICDAARQVALRNEAFNGRFDLVLSSGNQLLLLEFMRPGLTLDRDHIDRFNEYLDIIQESLNANTALGFTHLSGYIIADNLINRSGMTTVLTDMRLKDRYAMTWESLIDQAKQQWREFLTHVKLRAPDDARVQAIAVEPEPAQEAA